MIDHAAECAALVKQFTPEGERVARQLALTHDAGQDALITALLEA